MRGSVGARLTAWFSAILATALLLAGIGVRWGMRQSIHDTVDRDLQARLEGMRQFLDKEEKDPESGSLSEELAEQASMTAAGAYFRIAGQDGQWIYQSKGSEEWSMPGPRLPEQGRIQTVETGGGPARVLAASVRVGTIQIGAPLGSFYEMLNGFLWTAVVVSPALLFLAGAGGYWLSRRALEPVDAITRTAQTISEKDLSQRLPERGVGDELDRLSATLNAMFGRLESSFERVTRFTADASHELRTPVAVIRTTAELARSRPRSEQEYERALDTIQAESEHISALIDDLLLLARADAGKEEFAGEPLDLRESVRSVCAKVRVLAEARGIGLEEETSAEVRVQADGRAVHRVLLILLENAIQYTAEGGSIKVAATMEAGWARVTVRDTGVGIAAEDLPHIFERFYRASKDRSRRGGGVGLGLAIAEWIAARHGGTITVESVWGVGSTFILSLPVFSEFIQNQR
ncbi:MAG: heavy metal sensor histidine kinase [Acidobacteria bacterium]|nr:heavy metal sensor histidine kinase [Acidobacteriota bacterium]